MGEFITIKGDEKQVGVKLKIIANVLNMTERETELILSEVERTPFRKFYEVKDSYYFGNIIEAIKYYKIIKQAGKIRL